jgi:ubiquitin C-terminal hydrolase
MESRVALSPYKLLSNLKVISPTLRLHAQEDAHEFLRLLIEAMQRCCNLDSSSSSSSPSSSSSSSMTPSSGLPTGTSDAQRPYPFNLFDGTLQSSVVCSVCRTVSNTFDPTEDLGAWDLIHTCTCVDWIKLLLCFIISCVVVFYAPPHIPALSLSLSPYMSCYFVMVSFLYCRS